MLRYPLSGQSCTEIAHRISWFTANLISCRDPKLWLLQSMYQLLRRLATSIRLCNPQLETVNCRIQGTAPFFTSRDLDCFYGFNIYGLSALVIRKCWLGLSLPF